MGEKGISVRGAGQKCTDRSALSNELIALGNVSNLFWLEPRHQVPHLAIALGEDDCLAKLIGMVRLDAISEIASIATELNDKMENIGARRLHTVMTSLLEDILFQLPDKKISQVKLDKKMVRDKLSNISEDEDLRRYIL